MNNSQLVVGQDVCGCNQAIVENGLFSRIGEALPGPMKLQYAYVRPNAEPIKNRQERVRHNSILISIKQLSIQN